MEHGYRLLWTVFCWPLAVLPHCQGATIEVGHHLLDPHTSNQMVAIHVRGGDQIQGLNLHVQVADGGPHPLVGGAIPGPSIANIDLLTGTIFAGRLNNIVPDVQLPQLWVQSITPADGTVVADGLLATLEIDTTGFSSGRFALALAETHNGPSDFAGIPIEIADGSIQIVPEPGSGLILCFTLLWGWISVRRHGFPYGSLRSSCHTAC